MSAAVRLVGIGPGHPGLLTIRAADAIGQADTIRHPEGCDPGVLRLARPGADVAPLRSLDEIVAMAGRDRVIAVLYSGDPYAFSAGSRLAERLEAAGVDFEVVPGLLLETAAPALSGIPLTVSGEAESISIGNGRPGPTIVRRLAPGGWESGIRDLLAAGHSRTDPASLIINPGEDRQDRVGGTLGELADRAAGMDAAGDALLVTGQGVPLARRLDTMARRPLHGKTVLVTRPRHQVEPFRRQLAELGASVVEIPTIEIRPIPPGEKVAAAIKRLSVTQLVIFTSANAVEIFFDLLFDAGSDARSLHACRVCAIGAETARSVEEHGVRPEMVAGEYSAEGLAEALRGWNLGEARVLVPRAKIARDALPALLAQRGAEVEVLHIYETVPPQAATEALRRLFEGHRPHVATFTSSSTVINFVRAFPNGELGDALSHTAVACIGPATADTARQLGLRVDIIAREYTTRGLAAAIAESLG